MSDSFRPEERNSSDQSQTPEPERTLVNFGRLLGERQTSKQVTGNCSVSSNKVIRKADPDGYGYPFGELHRRWRGTKT